MKVDGSLRRDLGAEGLDAPGEFRADSFCWKGFQHLPGGVVDFVAKGLSELLAYA